MPQAWSAFKNLVKQVPGTERLYLGMHGCSRRAAQWGRELPAQLESLLAGDVRRLRKLRQRYQGRRGFVLGNGPSLLKTDPARLQNEISIASNGIFLLYDQTPFRPTFYTVEDVLVAEDRAAAINRLTDVTKIFPRDVRHFLQRTGETLYVDFLREYPGFPQFSEDLAQGAYWGGTVTYLNLQLAYHLGLNPIYLIGIDHSYTIPSDVQVEGTRLTSQSDDPNHFHPDYFGRGYRWHDPRVDRMEEGYRAARRFLEARGVKVYNATAGGKLEVFERVEFESLFEHARS